MRRRRWLWYLASGLAIGFVLYLTVCFVILDVLITPQMIHPYRPPEELGFNEAKTTNFKSPSDGITLRGWIVPAQGHQIIVLIHGIHGHAWDCQAPDYVQAYNTAGFDVFLFDLRGHGRSEGERLGLGLKERGDVRAAIDALLELGYQPGRIGLHGSSYGASVALLSAAEISEVGAVVADSAFTSVTDAVGGEFERRIGFPSEFALLFRPGLRFLALLLYSLDIDEAAPEKAIEKIQPHRILLIHGTEDSVIPHENGRRLKAAAGPTAQLWSIPGDHTEGVRLDMGCGAESPTKVAFLRKVTKFFKETLKD